MQKADDLFAQIGYGKLSARQVLDKLVPHEQLKEKAPEQRGGLGRQAGAAAPAASRIASRCAASTI